MNSVYATLQPHIIVLWKLPRSEKDRGLTLSLLMLRILTDNPDASFSLDNLALLTNRFNG